MVRKATRKYLKKQGTKVSKKDPKHMDVSEKAQYKKLVKKMGIGVAAGILTGMVGGGGVRVGHAIVKGAKAAKRIGQTTKKGYKSGSKALAETARKTKIKAVLDKKTRIPKRSLMPKKRVIKKKQVPGHIREGIPKPPKPPKLPGRKR